MGLLEGGAPFVKIDDQRANFGIVQGRSHRGHARLEMAIANASRDADVVASIAPGRIHKTRWRAAGQGGPVAAGTEVAVQLGNLPAAAGWIMLGEIGHRKDETQAALDDEE